VSAPLVFLPVLGAPVLHAPVLRWDLARPLRRPISERLFGANKTWRGAVFMTAGPIAAAALAWRVPAYRRRLPPAVAAADPRLVGALLGTAVWVGELPNSFAKRRLGIPPGGRRRDAVGVAIAVLDQADWVPAGWLLLSPVWRMTPRQAAAVFALVAAIHLPINWIGYAIGARGSRL
jgi:CDP-diacylglycerol--serine O-phosphatidyltransferase